MTLSAADIDVWARDAGFIAGGATDLGPNAHADELDRWLAAGYAGTMRYLHRQAKRRKQPSLIDEGARSAVVVLDNYYHADATVNAAAPKIAKYARGRDYHELLPERLEPLAARLRGAGASLTRCYADAGPVPERELAWRAGLGWIGKNTMLLRRGVGSWFFIGTIFTDLEIVSSVTPDVDHCGTCTRCLDACPTEAFPAPGVLDATRCLSYLTIEQKGPIARELAEAFDGWAFGCDICNDVCPWNRRFAAEANAYPPADVLAGRDATFFDQMSEAEFEQHFSDTPFSRPGLSGMRRNFHAAFHSTKASHHG